ncbi:MAG: hypothetical protein NTY19_04955 [Planctomycetota bacterium]|nr:hypothetical protein [Planctomycetota bacterium]
MDLEIGFVCRSSQFHLLADPSKTIVAQAIHIAPFVAFQVDDWRTFAAYADLVRPLTVVRITFAVERSWDEPIDSVERTQDIFPPELVVLIYSPDEVLSVFVAHLDAKVRRFFEDRIEHLVCMRLCLWAGGGRAEWHWRKGNRK